VQNSFDTIGICQANGAFAIDIFHRAFLERSTLQSLCGI
jgi:hypothetical protein